MDLGGGELLEFYPFPCGICYVQPWVLGKELGLRGIVKGKELIYGAW